MTSTRPFRFGPQAFTVSSGKEWLDIARRGEDLGYRTLFTTDHYFGPATSRTRPATGPSTSRRSPR